MSKQENTKGKQQETQADDEEDLFVTLTLDDDSTLECLVLTIFEVEDVDYIALLPMDEKGEPNEEGEVLLYKYTEDENGDPTLDNIEDDDEYEAVADRFDELLDEEDFEDM